MNYSLDNQAFDYIDFKMLDKKLRKILNLFTAEDIVAIVEYNPDGHYPPKIKQSIEPFHLITNYENTWPGAKTSLQGKIDFYSLATKCKKQLRQYKKHLLDYDCMDMSLDFFIIRDETVVLYAVVHEEKFAVHKELLNDHKSLFSKESKVLGLI